MIIPKSIPINFCKGAMILFPLSIKVQTIGDFGHTSRVSLHLTGFN